MLICCFYIASHLNRKHFAPLIIQATAFGVLCKEAKYKKSSPNFTFSDYSK